MPYCLPTISINDLAQNHRRTVRRVRSGLNSSCSWSRPCHFHQCPLRKSGPRSMKPRMTTTVAVSLPILTSARQKPTLESARGVNLGVGVDCEKMQLSQSNRHKARGRDWPRYLKGCNDSWNEATMAHGVAESFGTPSIRGWTVVGPCCGGGTALEGWLINRRPRGRGGCLLSPSRSGPVNATSATEPRPPIVRPVEAFALRLFNNFLHR